MLNIMAIPDHDTNMYMKVLKKWENALERSVVNDTDGLSQV